MGGVRPETKLVTRFDKDNNQRLNAAERKAAYEFLQKEIAEGRGPRRFGGGRGGGESAGPIEPGPKVSPADVKNYGEAPFYEAKTYRTLFLDFENEDWSKELVAFNNTDVEVPATLTVDGKKYKEVGVHHRGASSFGVRDGQKRSINIALDFVNQDQNVLGYRTLNLLNSHRDPTYVRTILYYHVARQYIPAPKANLTRVVINGESWGPYVNAQQFNKEFIKENFGSTKGARWKVPGSPRGNGGLAYLGEDPAEYRKLYEIKTKDDAKSWKDFINLCRVLNQTESNKLETALSPILNIDGVLRFLALENVLINSDGYWIRSSDYNIYKDENGKFHIVPHDANETFAAPQGPGGGGGGIELDPMKGSDETSKPLLNKLLAAPGLKKRYLGYVRHIAENWLDWKNLAPIAEGYQALISEDIKADTHKLESAEAFARGLTQDAGRQMSIKSFAEKRRAFLLSRDDVKNAPLPKL